MFSYVFCVAEGIDLCDHIGYISISNNNAISNACKAKPEFWILSGSSHTEKSYLDDQSAFALLVYLHVEVLVTKTRLCALYWGTLYVLKLVLG